MNNTCRDEYVLKFEVDILTHDPAGGGGADSAPSLAFSIAKKRKQVPTQNF